MERILKPLLMAALIAVLVTAAARAQQHDHDLYHAQYQGWYSNVGANCCNSKDCGAIEDDHLRENVDHLEVRVEEPGGQAQWCPVTWDHLIRKSGKIISPDWNVAHACIQSRNDVSPGTATCSRLICFMDKVRE